MKRFLLILALLPLVLKAQEPDEKIYDFVEIEPEFPGGPEAMNNWIVQHITYPMAAWENGEHGIVYVKFIIAKTGEVTAAKVVKGVSESLDSEAVRVVSLMPKWKPGMQKGKPVAVNFTLPINFKLGSDRHDSKKKRRN